MAEPFKENRANLNESDRALSDLRASYPELSRLLIQRQTELLEHRASSRANLDEQVMTSPGDEADASVLDTSADYFLKLANSQQRELVEIRDAFDRMERGVYGLCESCSEPIALERLRKLPFARLCIDCQSASERSAGAAYPHSKPTL